MENGCALGLESAGAHSFFKCNFLFRNFSGNIKEILRKMNVHT